MIRFQKSVHPRVCGEQLINLGRHVDNAGSSPRVRGTGRRHQIRQHRDRFIPACAGNRTTISITLVSIAVHPRVCGEQVSSGSDDSSHSGSSPRVRGTGVRDKFADRRYRFIPACAGNRSSGLPRYPTTAVHPRVCGEQIALVRPLIKVCGSSPRVRGTVFRRWRLHCQIRFIPACAGNSTQAFRPCAGRPVHPRVCGEQSEYFAEWTDEVGSSPRVRGTESNENLLPFGSRFIPACAGNSDGPIIIAHITTVHPRVCGEQFALPILYVHAPGSSPRVRGTVASSAFASDQNRFIPACAGNSLREPILYVQLPVHPRVCGEQIRPAFFPPPVPGSSPRVRGTGEIG